MATSFPRPGRGSGPDRTRLAGTVTDRPVATFVDPVVPLLVRRGLFRAEYEGTTLREHYGLARPENLYATTHPTTERTSA